MTERIEALTIEDAGVIDEGALTESLKATLGEAIIGVSLQRGALIVHHTRGADAAQIRTLIEAHQGVATDLLATKATARAARKQAFANAATLLRDDTAWTAATAGEKMNAVRVLLLRWL